MRLNLLLAIVACVALPAPAVAQPRTFPSKPLRILLGYTPGGTADIVARLVGEKLTTTLGQPVVVENRPGASGNIAAQVAAKSTLEPHPRNLLGSFRPRAGSTLTSSSRSTTNRSNHSREHHSACKAS